MEIEGEKWKRVPNARYDIYQAFYDDDFCFTLEVEIYEGPIRFWMEKEGFFVDFYLTRDIVLSEKILRRRSMTDIYRKYQDTLYLFLEDLKPFLKVETATEIPESFSSDSETAIQIFTLPAMNALLDLYEFLERVKIDSEESGRI